MPLITHDKSSVFFFHIPKTGGSTVEAYFSQRCDISFLTKFAPEDFPCTPQHWHANVVREFFHPSDLKTNFMIVRNPLDRMISEYHYRFRKKKRFHFGKSDFDRFVEKCFRNYKKNVYVMGNHIRPQSEFELSNTKVFKFEDGIENCISDICKVLGLNFNKDEIVIHNAKSSHEQVAYSKNTKRAIEDFYKEDFDRYGY